MRTRAFTTGVLVIWGLWGAGAKGDEGMYPVSALEGLNLQSKGLQLTPAEIFSNDEETCLVDGICRVNGCTGSFVSPDGLIITNHHCAYRAIQTASTPEHDYLKDGFIAKSRQDEVPSQGYTVRITESFRDVSTAVLEVVKPEMSFLERGKAIEKRQKELEQQAEQEHPGLRAEVAEMFTGKTYVLFLYTYLKDVRLVFAPPASIGNFGGAVDNWEWPRHTGDFSLMRAYVAPDGASAEYSAENVPYRPKRYLPVAAGGVQEEDYVMLLGYPGRTARHKTSHFLQYERDYRLPHLVDLYQREIAIMEGAGKEDRAIALKHTSRIQSLANVEKRSRGQLKGLTRAKIVESRQQEESELQSFIEADSERARRYGTILKELADFYRELSGVAPRELNERNLTSTCRTLAIAFTVWDAVQQRAKPDIDRESAYMDRNYNLTLQQLKLSQQDLHYPTDRLMLAEILQRLSPYIDRQTWAPLAAGVVEGQVAAVDQPWNGGELEERIAAFYASTQMHDVAFVDKCLQMSVDELTKVDDPALQLIAIWYPRLMELRELDKERDGRLNQLYGELQTVKSEYQASSFVPDANGTLRLTFGYVRGFSPEDAVYKSPFTTLKGMLDKVTGSEPFTVPQRVVDVMKAGDFGPFLHPTLQQVPVAMLYSTDTTGGNSGSPVMNARGELVGVNFDRAFEATINDFAWNENYSRSIGVDIRYVLWIVGKVYGATHLLEEMGVSSN